jgi:hypothetical protein
MKRLMVLFLLGCVAAFVFDRLVWALGRATQQT